MRLRLFVFLPPAALVTLLLLVSASSFVLAVERSLIAEAETPSTLIRVQSYESECAALSRELRTFALAVTKCESEPSCLGSPLLCPVTMNAEMEHEYQRLRSALTERCSVPRGVMDSAGSIDATSTCAVGGDGRGVSEQKEPEPRYFVF